MASPMSLYIICLTDNRAMGREDYSVRIDYTVKETGKPPGKYTFSERGALYHLMVGEIGDYNGPSRYAEYAKTAKTNLLYSSPQLQIWSRKNIFQIHKFGGEIDLPVNASLYAWTEFANLLYNLIVNDYVPSCISNNGPGVNIRFYIPTKYMEVEFKRHVAEFYASAGFTAGVTEHDEHLLRRLSYA